MSSNTNIITNHNPSLSSLLTKDSTMLPLISLISKLYNIISKECPHCHSTDFVKYGKYAGRQRYLCHNCHSTFNDYTGTFLDGTHNMGKWPLFIYETLHSHTLRASSSLLQVSYVSLFYWRHKLLAALNNYLPNELAGKVEAADKYMAYSQKGRKYDNPERETRTHGGVDHNFNILNDKVCVLAACDSSNSMFAVLVTTKVITPTSLHIYLDKYINEKTIFCSPRKPAYMQFAKSTKIKKHLYPKKSLDKQNIYVIEEMFAKIFNWLSIFKGVATKYLNNYLPLFSFLQKYNFNINESAINELAGRIQSKRDCLKFESIRKLGIQY